MKSGYLDDMPLDAATKARLRKLLAENARQARAEMNALRTKTKQATLKSEKPKRKKSAYKKSA